MWPNVYTYELFPELGVFYFYKGRAYQISEKVNSKKVYKTAEGWHSFDIVHEDAWPELLKTNPELPQVSWKHIPRGRVFFNGRDYVVECDPVLKTRPLFKGEIIFSFSLPQELDISERQLKTVFKFNPFYSYEGDETWK